MSRLTDQMVSMLLRNYAHEVKNSLIYSLMGNHIGVRGFTNSAKYFLSQAEEEKGHAAKVLKYMTDRNAMIMSPPIPEVSTNYSDLRFAFNGALNLEFETTQIWQETYDLAVELNDGITKQLANEFLDIQRKEEDEIIQHNDELSLIGENIPLQKLWDNTYQF